MYDAVLLVLTIAAFALSNFSWTDQVWAAGWLGAIFFLRLMRRKKWTTAGILGFVTMQVAYLAGLLPLLMNMGDPAGTMESSVLLRYILIWQVMPGVLYFIPFVVDKLLHRRLPRALATLVFPLSVVAVELISSFLVGNLFPYSQTQYSIRPLVHISSFLGFYGLSFLIAWFASVVNLVWELKWDVKKLGKFGVVFCAILVALPTISGIMIAYPEKADHSVMMAGITIKDDLMDRVFGTNFEFVSDPDMHPSEYVEALRSPESHLAEIRQKTEQAIAAGAELIVWQEFALTLESDVADEYLDAMRTLADAEDVYIAASYARILSEEEREDKIIRNLSVLLTPEGEIGWEYDKSFPVYGSEDAFSGKGPGEIPYHDTPFGRIGVAICYDMHFSHLFKQVAEKNIDLLLGPSNDGDVGVPIHTLNNAFRAVEYGFTIVRVTQGFSAVHDPYYQQWAAQLTVHQGNENFYVNVPVISVTTFYSRVGFLFPYLAVVSLGILAALAFIRKRRDDATESLRMG